jgi:hypothetical protein
MGRAEENDWFHAHSPGYTLDTQPWRTDGAEAPFHSHCCCHTAITVVPRSSLSFATSCWLTQRMDHVVSNALTWPPGSLAAASAPCCEVTAETDMTAYQPRARALRSRDAAVDETWPGETIACQKGKRSLGESVTNRTGRSVKILDWINDRSLRYRNTWYGV